MNEFYKSLKMHRVLACMLQEDVCKKLGVSVARYSTWETGRSEPSYEHLIKLAEIFGITVDELLGIDRKPQIDDALNDKDLLELYLFIKVMDPSRQRLALKLAKQAIKLVDTLDEETKSKDVE